MVKLYPWFRYHSVYTLFNVKDMITRILAYKAASGQVE